tara:strand:- start:2819 stop:3352 length:534 start_codon:yes stop_codon:yes gene_type:complete
MQKMLETHLPQILGGLWIITVIVVLVFAVITMKTHKSKWRLNTERFKNFKYVEQGGRKRNNWIQKIRLDHYEDYHKAFKGLFIAHVYEKSKRLRQKYDVYIYITSTNSKYMHEIERADFMLGPNWKNHVIPSQKSNGRFGLSVSASEPFLCTCCVTLRDGRRLFLDRYVDFEMDKLT